MKKILFTLKNYIPLFCGLFLLVNFLYGQEYRTFSEELDLIYRIAKRRIGPFRIYPTLQIRNIGYDGNVYRMPTTEESISDFTATVAAQINAYLLYKNSIIFSISGTPEYVFYASEERERSFNQNFTTSLKYQLFQRLVISGDYYHQNARRRATSEFDVRANQLRNRYRFHFYYETSRGTSFGFTGSKEDIRYEDELTPGSEFYLSRQLNRDETEIFVEVNYRIFSDSLFVVRGGYSEYEFKHIEAKWRDSYSYQLYYGLRFPILGRLRGTVMLGYKKLTPKALYKKKLSGIVGYANLDLRISRFTLRFRYEKDSDFSYWTENVYFMENLYGAGLSFYLTRFLRFDYDFSYGDLDYPEPIVVRMPDESYQEMYRKDIYRFHRAGFVVRVIRNTGIGLTINFWERDSSDSRYGTRDRWFVGGYLTYEF